MPWRREVLWYVVVGLAGAVVFLQSWPVALVLAALTTAASLADRLAHDTRRREVLGEEILQRLGALESRADSMSNVTDSISTRLTTVENRTRPIGR